MIGLLVIFFIGVMSYDGGDNVLYDRIFDRLTIENGELKGNNRVDADFHNLLMDMLDSPDIFFGRDGSKLDWGNSWCYGFPIRLWHCGDDTVIDDVFISIPFRLRQEKSDFSGNNYIHYIHG